MELSSGATLDSDAIGVAGLLAPLTTWRARRGRGLIVRRLDIQAGELGIGVSVEEEEEEEEEVGGGGTGANKDRGMEAEGGTTQEEEVEVEVEEKEEVAAEEVVVVVAVAVVEVEGGHRLVCSGFKEEEEGGGLEDSTL